MDGRKPISRKFSDVNRPPAGMPWVWSSLELLSSDAWSTLPINSFRLVNFLIIEHMNHGGQENGYLLAPYNQLQKWGIGRRLIRAAIDDLVRRGLVEVQEGGLRGRELRPPNLFRLTFLPSSRPGVRAGLREWLPPTDDWRSYRREPEEAGSADKQRLPLTDKKELKARDIRSSR
jgi:hypothetical protein